MLTIIPNHADWNAIFWSFILFITKCHMWTIQNEENTELVSLWILTTLEIKSSFLTV